MVLACAGSGHNMLRIYAIQHVEGLNHVWQGMIINIVRIKSSGWSTMEEVVEVVAQYAFKRASVMIKKVASSCVG